ncbi:MAG: hypothetical protein RMA76_21285 [Deltaproteobacteria bacterium]|jgi:hypothetical protein
MRKFSFVVLWTLVACTPDPLTMVDAPPRDAGSEVVEPERDAGSSARDAGESEMNPPDAGFVDAGMTEPPRDAGPRDGGPDVPPMPGDPPPFPTYSGGACPTLTGGPTSASAVNSGFPTGTDERSFRLIVPMNYDPSTPTPVVFAWHWLNASSNSFVREGELETATEQMGFIAVLPDKKLKPDGDKAYLFDWPFVEVSNAPSELLFVDDLLACVSEQFNVDRHGVYGIGVSAGALWLTYMSSQPQIDHFAAVESLSGGMGEVAGVWGIGFTPRPHKFPALVLWGGSRDWLGLNFHEASLRYRDALVDDGHFVVACTHDSGHSMPPIEPPNPGQTRFVSLWRFMLDHPYGMAPGDSPYLTSGLPPEFPTWCEIP